MRTSAVAILLIGLGWCGSALAYSDTTTFSRDPSADPAGGGGGIYFTGSPRYSGLNCTVCHIGGPSDISIRLSALEDGTPARLFDDGYQPGVLYEIEVAFAEDRLAPETACDRSGPDPCDLNLFAMEIVDRAGRPAGKLCPVRPNETTGTGRCAGCSSRREAGTLVEDDCSVVLADGFDDVAFGWRNGVTAYSFFWRAPEEDVGALSAFVAGVDGRGPETPESEATSYQNDGTVAVDVALPSPTTPVAPACGSVPPREGAAWLVVLAAVLVVRRSGRTKPNESGRSRTKRAGR